LLNGVVGGDNKDSINEIDVSPFNFSRADISICPDFDVVGEGICVEVVKNDSFLTGISVKPLVLGLDVSF